MFSYEGSLISRLVRANFYFGVRRGW